MKQQAPGELRLVSWNIEDHILDPEVRAAIVDTNADIIILVEGYPESLHDSVELKAALATFHAAQYRTWTELYHDQDGRGDRHGYIVLMKHGIDATVEAASMAGGRHALFLRLRHLLIVGCHLDDRHIETRLAQVDSILERVEAILPHEDATAIMVGDFNSTHHDEWFGRVVNNRMLKWLIEFTPELEPGTASTPPQTIADVVDVKLGRFKSLQRRLADMTSPANVVLERFEEAGWRDADNRHMPTKLASPKLPLALAQLDHFLVLNNGRIVVKRFERMRHAVKSDHLGLTATIRF